jgi:hypothetical protein
VSQRSTLVLHGSYGADVEIPRIEYSVRQLSPWAIHMNGNNLIPIIIVLLALCVGASRAWADPVITGFSLALIDGKDGKVKPLDSKDIDRQTADILPLLEVKIQSDDDDTAESPGYLLTIEGTGAGRSNEAEGTIEDWQFSQTRKQFSFSRYEAFLLTYPCVEKAKIVATITTASAPTKILSRKTLETKQLNCYAN